MFPVEFVSAFRQIPAITYVTLLCCLLSSPWPWLSHPAPHYLLGSQELIRLLQQTVRSSQYDKYFTSHQISQGVPRDTLELLHQKDEQILGLSSQLERFGLEKESLQQEVRTLKSTVGELSERLGMLMETIQAKDEVIIKLSACEGSVSSPTAGPSSPLAMPASRDQLELDRLKVRAGYGLALWTDTASSVS